jgi:Hemerythrin HHE cation binding domain
MAKAKRKASNRSRVKAKSGRGAGSGRKSRGGASAGGQRGVARASSSRQGARPRTGNGGEDAIALLMSDHREVERLFREFNAASDSDTKRELAENICRALEVHTMIEEEIFYPAFLEATDDKDKHHEAELEHANAKQMIADIESSDPEDDYYDARVKVLSEMIRHHVNEEEKSDGLFAEARRSSMDLVALGRAMRARKEELMTERTSPGSPPPRMTPAQRAVESKP